MHREVPMVVGKPVERVDAFEKVTGRAKYTADLFPRNALIAKVMHSTIANGKVLSFDLDEAGKIPGVVKILTCFDVPDIQYPTAGHPWSTEKKHQDISDRKLLNQRVRFYGDDIAVVIAETEIAAKQALALIQVKYEEYPPVFTVADAMKPGATVIHEEKPGNVIVHSQYEVGKFDNAITEPGLIKVEGDYHTQPVQHCHIENASSFAYMEGDKIVVVSSTQIPHIVRRICTQALGCSFGQVKIVKPYIGGGFGNKQDALTETL